jgi:hypothetical protein
VCSRPLHELCHAAVGNQHHHDLHFIDTLCKRGWDAFGIYVAPKQEGDVLYTVDRRMQTALEATHEWARLPITPAMNHRQLFLQHIRKWQRHFKATTVYPDPNKVFAQLPEGTEYTFFFRDAHGFTVGSMRGTT